MCVCAIAGKYLVTRTGGVRPLGEIESDGVG